jgi:hypothetical protein
MNCPGSGQASDLAAWLDSVSSIAPAKKWLWAKCQACECAYEIKLEQGRAVMGSVDGGPGMTFIPHKTYPQPGLTARWEGHRVHVRHSGRSWTLKAG